MKGCNRSTNCASKTNCTPQKTPDSTNPRKAKNHQNPDNDTANKKTNMMLPMKTHLKNDVIGEKNQRTGGGTEILRKLANFWPFRAGHNQDFGCQTMALWCRVFYSKNQVSVQQKSGECKQFVRFGDNLFCEQFNNSTFFFSFALFFLFSFFHSLFVVSIESRLLRRPRPLPSSVFSDEQVLNFVDRAESIARLLDFRDRSVNKIIENAQAIRNILKRKETITNSDIKIGKLFGQIGKAALKAGRIYSNMHGIPLSDDRVVGLCCHVVCYRCTILSDQYTENELEENSDIKIGKILRGIGRSALQVGRIYANTHGISHWMTIITSIEHIIFLYLYPKLNSVKILAQIHQYLLVMMTLLKDEISVEVISDLSFFYKTNELPSSITKTDDQILRIIKMYFDLYTTCWSNNSSKRPSFEQIILKLEEIDNELYSGSTNNSIV
jgi:hypothetical protein